VLALATLALALVVAMWWPWHDGQHSGADSTGAETELATQSRAIGSARAIPVGRLGHLRQIGGTVLFDDAPVHGASVRLVSEANRAGLTPELHVLTDEYGRFDFGPQRWSDYVVVAEMPHLTAAMQMIDTRDPTSDPSQLHLVLHACEAAIYGKVRDASGGAIAKAHVAWAAAFATVGTDAGDDGNYDLCVPMGETEAFVTAAGYAAIGDSITAFGRVRRDFELSPEAVVHGRVVRADDHTPVPGAVVELVFEGTTYHPPLHASSDADGRFHIEGATPGPHVLMANADRLATVRPMHVIAEVGGSQEEVICAVVPTLRISGRLTERSTGVGIEGATLYLSPRNFDYSTQRLQATTQPDGSFEIEDALPGEFQPSLTGADLVNKPKPIKIANADIEGLVLEAERLASVSGRVTRGGKPVDGVKVNATDQPNSTQSDHDGRFTLRGLKAGTHKLYAESQRVGAFTKNSDVTVGKGEHKSGIELELDLAASISGAVVDQTNSPVSGAIVHFSLLHDQDHDGGVATTAEDGSFTARALSGGGDYIYEVTRRDGEMPLRPADGKRYSAIAVRDGQTRVTGVRIKVRVEHLVIAGRVIDAAGRPIPDASVTATRRDAFAPSSGTTDANGAFAIRDVQAGMYEVTASTVHGDQHEPSVAAGRTDVLIRLAGLGSIEGTIDGFAAAPRIVVRHYDHGFRSYDVTSSGRSFRISDLPAGEYRVTATSSDSAADTNVTVSAGKASKLVLHAQGFGAVEGTLIDERTHAPISDAFCYSQVDEQHSHGQAMTDEDGSFRMERAPVGNNLVACVSDATIAKGNVVVTAGQTAHVDLIEIAMPARPHGHAGLVLESPLGFEIVQSVEPGGPAARAGIQVGDLVLEAGDEEPARRYGGSLLAEIENHEPGTAVKLKIERGDQELVVTLILAAAP
jgi:hypothetical protein